MCFQKKFFSIVSILILIPLSSPLFALPTKIIPNVNGRFNQSSCTDEICIAAGFVITQNNAIHPMLVQSNIGGNQFTSVGTVTNYPENGSLLSVDCAGSGQNALCVAAGYTGNAASEAKPLLFQSQDGGQNWNTILVPNISNTGLFRKVSCTGSGSTAICVAVGTTASGSPSTSPLLALSNDGGNTWHTASINDLPNNYGDLTGVSCTKGVCVAIGKNDTNIPIIVQTSDRGNTWINKNYLFMQTLNMLFSDVNCAFGNGATLCTIVGKIGTDNHFNPVIYQTKFDSKDWERNTNIQFPTSWSGALSTINCAGNTTGISCIAAGQAGPDITQLSPLVLKSQNSSNSWSMETINNPAPDWNTLLATKCVANQTNFCFAVGYGGGNVMYPILAVSENGFDNWYAKNIPNMPEQGLLRTASCTPNGSMCIATGYSQVGNINNALIVASYDNGNTWNIKNITSISPPPAPANTLMTCNTDQTRCIAVQQKGTGAYATYYWSIYYITWQTGTVSGCMPTPLDWAFSGLACGQNIDHCVAVGVQETFPGFTDSNVITTADGINWTNMDVPLPPDGCGSPYIQLDSVTSDSAGMKFVAQGSCFLYMDGAPGGGKLMNMISTSLDGGWNWSSTDY